MLERTAAPNPSLRRMLAVCQTVFTASRPPDTRLVRVSSLRWSSASSSSRWESRRHSTVSAIASAAATASRP